MGTEDAHMESAADSCAISALAADETTIILRGDVPVEASSDEETMSHNSDTSKFYSDDDIPVEEDYLIEETSMIEEHLDEPTMSATHELLSPIPSHFSDCGYESIVGSPGNAIIENLDNIDLITDLFPGYV